MLKEMFRACTSQKKVFSIDSDLMIFGDLGSLLRPQSSQTFPEEEVGLLPSTYILGLPPCSRSEM